MRRHLMLHRVLKRRYRLARPRYSLRNLWYGGSTFTMLLFVLLLISSALMYYYFQKCRLQERELTRWRTGISMRDESTVDRDRGPISKIVHDVGERLTGTPVPEETTATSTPTTEQVEAKATPAPTPTETLPAPEQTPAVKRAEAPQSAAPDESSEKPPRPPQVAQVVTQADDVSETKRPEPSTARERSTPAQAEERKSSEVTNSSKQTQPRGSSSPTKRAPVTSQAPKRTPVQTRDNDPIGSLLKGN